MPKIHTTTFIGAPVERVFDLSRHIALYKLIFQSRKEKLTSGAASTLVGKNEARGTGENDDDEDHYSSAACVVH
jgi:hypothetical protein